MENKKDINTKPAYNSTQEAQKVAEFYRRAALKEAECTAELVEIPKHVQPNAEEGTPTKRRRISSGKWVFDHIMHVYLRFFSLRSSRKDSSNRY